MKQAIYGALIIAFGMIFSNLIGAYLLKDAITNVPRDVLLKSIEGAVEKDKNGSSRIETIGREISKSFTSGLLKGFGSLTDSQLTEVQKYKDKFEISEVKPVPSSYFQQEKVIRYVENKTGRAVSSISFQLIVKDSSGTLIDVASSDGKISGGIGVGGKIGFELVHETKPPRDPAKPDTVIRNSYSVNVVNFKFLPNQ